MKCVGAAPCQCHSPGGVYTVSPGRITTTSPPRDWARPMPSVTCNVCPQAWVCHAVRAQGANRTVFTRIRDGSSHLAITSKYTSPVNISAGPLVDVPLGSFCMVVPNLLGGEPISR